MIDNIKVEATKAIEELIEISKISKGDIVVIGCSTSEICGQMIGTDSNVLVAEEVFLAIYKVLKEKGIYIAAQCCEHLNRAIIIEKEAVRGLEIVNVIPQPKAGGSFATAAYKYFTNPVAVEEIKADAGLDIGGTLIGMHLKKVAIPLRLNTNKIGEASLSAARTRAKFIGGSRAIYDEEMM